MEIDKNKKRKKRDAVDVVWDIIKITIIIIICCLIMKAFI